jgi:hypothetical protein
VTHPDPDPQEIVVDDLTHLTDYQPTEHGVDVTARNLALWILSLIEADSDVGRMRVVIGPGRAALASIRVEQVAGEGDDAYAVVLR